MKTRWFILLLLMSGLVGRSLPAAEVYTWTDASGMVHITDRPPPPGARVTAVAKDKRPIVETFAADSETPAPVEAAREQIDDSRSAWQDVQALTEKLNAAQAAYEDAADALAKEQAKYTYSATRRKAPRQTVVDLEEKARQAFTEYRDALDAVNKAELAARETEARAQRAIEAVNAPPAPPATLPVPPSPSP